MNEEEKKAIEFIKDLIAWDVRQDLYPNKEECEKLETILNLIEKLQKENEELHREINQRIKLKIENEKIVDTQFIYKPKIKDKIEELDIEISTCEYADDDSEEYKQEVEKDKAELLMAKKVLQQLLEESEKR